MRKLVSRRPRVPRHLAALGPDLPFVAEKTERALVNELSGDLAFETLRITTQWHKPSGSEGFFAVARYVEEKAKAAGPPGRPLDRPGRRVASWTCHRAEAWLLEGDGRRGEGDAARLLRRGRDLDRRLLAPADVTAELVDVGAGDRGGGLRGQGRPRQDRPRLRHRPVAVTEQAVWKRGAAGILAWSSTRLNPLADAPDQIAWQSVPDRGRPQRREDDLRVHPFGAGGQGPRGPASRREVSDRWGSSGAKAPVALRAHIVVESSRPAGEEDRDGRGADPGDRPVASGDRPDEPPPGGEVLGQRQPVRRREHAGDRPRAHAPDRARASSPRPRRGIRFWWCDEIYSEYRYFADHPGEEKKFLANLNQDMVGAKQSVGAAHAVHGADALVAAVLPVRRAGERARHGRRGQQRVPARLAGRLHPARRRLLEADLLAARNARALPRARPSPTSTRPTTSCSTTPGSAFPGTTLTNWPDEYIHSSRRRPLADRPDAVEAQRLRRRGDGPGGSPTPATPRSRAGGFRGRARRGAARPRLATAEAWIATGKGPGRRPAPRRREPPRPGAREGERGRGRLARASALAGAVPGDAAARERRPRCCADVGRWPSGERLGDASGGRRPRARAPRAPHSPRAAPTLDDWMALEHQVGDKRTARARREARGEGASRGAPQAGKSAAPSAGARRGDGRTSLSPLMATGGDELGRTERRRGGRSRARVCAEALSAGWWYYGEARRRSSRSSSRSRRRTG